MSVIGTYPSTTHQQHPHDWVREKRLSFEPKAVLMALVLRDGSRGCFPKTSTLLADLGCSRDMLFKCLSYLEDIGLITRHSRRPSQDEFSTTYTIHYDNAETEPPYAYKKRREVTSVRQTDTTPSYAHKAPVSVTRTDQSPSHGLSSVRLTDTQEEASLETSCEAPTSYVHRDGETSEGQSACGAVLDEVPVGTPDGASPAARSTSGELWWCGLDRDGTWWTHPDFTEGLDEWRSVVQELTVRAGYHPGVILTLIRGAWIEHQDVGAVVQELRRALAAE